MLAAVWQSWAANYTSLVVTTTRLSCQTWWKPTTRPPARGPSLDDCLSRPSGTAASAFSDSLCRRCPAPSSPLTSPSQTPSTCIGTSATKRSTISTTISTRTRTRMWTQRTEFGPVTLLALICAMSSFTSSLCWSEKKTELLLIHLTTTLSYWYSFKSVEQMMTLYLFKVGEDNQTKGLVHRVGLDPNRTSVRPRSKRYDFSCSERLQPKAEWKAGLKKGGGGVIWFSYRENSVNFQTVPHCVGLTCSHGMWEK